MHTGYADCRGFFKRQGLLTRPSAKSRDRSREQIVLSLLIAMLSPSIVGKQLARLKKLRCSQYKEPIGSVGATIR